MKLEEYRGRIDAIDDQMVDLFRQRMEVVREVGEYKKDHHLPLTNQERERKILTKVSRALPADLEDFGREFNRSMFEVSKAYEAMDQEKDSPLYKELAALLAAEPKAFSKRAAVACQGREGAFSQMAAERLFELHEIMYNASFEGVIKMVEEGLCEYGILPIENSTAGSVNQIYDLLVAHSVYIVRSTRVRVDHQLLAAPGAGLSGIRRVYSHPQAIAQCSRFLEGLGGVEVIPSENTAMAAMKVSLDETRSSASISSESCARLYGLDVLARNIQDNGSNHTRFVCIATRPQIYPGANRTSIMMVVPNKPGALFGVLSRFSATGANLVTLESRPIAGREFEFAFYFDIELSVYDDKYKSLLSELDHSGISFKYLGTYLEVI